MKSCEFLLCTIRTIVVSVRNWSSYRMATACFVPRKVRGKQLFDNKTVTFPAHSVSSEFRVNREFGLVFTDLAKKVPFPSA